MITGYYTLKPNAAKEAFYFRSEGPQGIFYKLVLFESIPGEGCFNLALCVLQNNKWVDDIVTNNDDFVKTISTVARAVLEFFEVHPDAVLQIGADERRRLNVYNGIFRRRLNQIQVTFEVQGIIEGRKEPYQPQKNYEGFEINLKKQ